MHFTLAHAASVLAFCSAASAAPAIESNTYAAASATSTAAAAPTANLAALGLSKTAQIFLSDTRVDAINNVLTKNEDFVFKFLDKATGGPGEGGEIIAANRKTFPALTGTGIGAALGKLGPCGFNTPHVHPRATELLFQIEGKVVSSMFPENAVNKADGTPREILNTINPFESTVYFQGSVHSQFNPDCTNSTFFAAQSAEDFGTGQVAQELFGTSDAAVAAVFGNVIDGADVDKLRGSISVNVALGVEECLKKCGIPKRK
ncbi:RmlC-like cupin domain-containing protein [Pseudomassariella vexata]|uniref:RmlC-like cupin domain-containing protein n=1 Tax=Pseudomassariella vexata TaxID=1141098 RepID=A0A1Y2DUU0_9PEZI|nr:RmlC-like cupin domain-containing protein [Pseudomassariella vexata]ORY62914.1 RmlC-like cupin domain-containing protein [Pseudomassariella vexata]